MDDKTTAVIGEIETQRNWALTRCAALAAELAEVTKKLQEAENVRSNDTPSR